MARVKEFRDDEPILRHAAHIIVWEGVSSLEDALRKAFRYATNAPPGGWTDSALAREEESFVKRARKLYRADRVRLETDAKARGESRAWANPDGSLPQPPIDATEHGRLAAEVAELRDLAAGLLAARRTDGSDRLATAEAGVRSALIAVLDERKPESLGVPRGPGDVFEQRRQMPWRTRDPQTALLPEIVAALVNYHEGNTSRLREVREAVREANSILRRCA